MVARPRLKAPRPAAARIVAGSAVGRPDLGKLRAAFPAPRTDQGKHENPMLVDPVRSLRSQLAKSEETSPLRLVGGRRGRSGQRRVGRGGGAQLGPSGAWGGEGELREFIRSPRFVPQQGTMNQASLKKLKPKRN